MRLTDERWPSCLGVLTDLNEYVNLKLDKHLSRLPMMPLVGEMQRHSLLHSVLGRVSNRSASGRVEGVTVCLGTGACVMA